MAPAKVGTLAYCVKANNQYWREPRGTLGYSGADAVSPSGVVPTQDVLSMLADIRRNLVEVSIWGCAVCV